MSNQELILILTILCGVFAISPGKAQFDVDNATIYDQDGKARVKINLGYANKGKDYNLTCVGQGNGSPFKYEWTKKTGMDADPFTALVTGVDYIVAGGEPGELTIKRVYANNAGEYVCFVTKRDGNMASRSSSLSSGPVKRARVNITYDPACHGNKYCGQLERCNASGRCECTRNGTVGDCYETCTKRTDCKDVGGDVCTNQRCACATETINEGGDDLVCKVNGNWGEWAAWTGCSATCGDGTKTRTRQCNKPAPAHGGKICPGSATDTGSCNKGTCPVETTTIATTIASTTADANPCQAQGAPACRNGGTCVNKGGSAHCDCPSGYSGPRCGRAMSESGSANLHLSNSLLCLVVTLMSAVWTGLV